LSVLYTAVHDNRVVGDPKLIELVEELADVAVMLDHAVRIQPDARDAVGRRLEVGPDVHPGGVEPDEKRRVRLRRLVDEGGGVAQDLLVDRLHPLAVQRPGVLNQLGAVGIEPRVEHAARAVLLPERRISRVVVALGLLLGIQVVQVAKELVKAVSGRQVLVLVAEVVLAELAGRIAVRLEQVRDRRRPVRDAVRRAGHPDREQAGPERVLPKDERGPPGGAGLLAVGVGEQRPFLRDPIDIWRPIPHDPVVVGTDVVDADVVAPDDQDVRLRLTWHHALRRLIYAGGCAPSLRVGRGSVCRCRLLENVRTANGGGGCQRAPERR
jgi:hypothetical protein